MTQFKLVYRWVYWASTALLLCPVLGFHQFATAGFVDPALAARISRDKTAKYIQILVDVDDAQRVPEASLHIAALPRKQRPPALAEFLKKRSEQPHAQVALALAQLGGRDVQSLWLVGKLAVNIPIDRVSQVARLPGVGRVYSDAILQAPMDRLALYRPSGTMRRDRLIGREKLTDQPNAPVIEAQPVEKTAIADHLMAMNLPAAWKDGHRGQGVTVAILDTGIDPVRAGLTQALQGSWFDPYGQRKRPTDTHGHGTHVAGLIVESQLFNRATAMAPEAKIMVARIFNDEGLGRLSAVHRSFEWLLNPDRNSTTQDTPDIVNNAWGLGNSVGRCDMEFAPVIAMFRAADIHMVFAAGNDGPAPGTSLSPANNPGALSVGGLNSNGASIWARSSRGPSACDASKPFPTVLALSQGIDVVDKATLVTDEPVKVQGTSFATALVSGMLAVLRSQQPDASVEEIEYLLAVHTQKKVDGSAVVGYLEAAFTQATAIPVRPEQVLAKDHVIAKDMSFVAVRHHQVDMQLLDPHNGNDRQVTIDSVSKPAFGGLVKINADETLTYIPRENFSGRDHFTYLLKDSAGKTSRRGVITVVVQK
jgi:serine protease AprX